MPLYEVLPSLMLSLLKVFTGIANGLSCCPLQNTGAAQQQSRLSVARFSWFLFDVIIKSLLLSLGTAAAAMVPSDGSPGSLFAPLSFLDIVCPSDGANRDGKVHIRQPVLECFKSLAKQLALDVMSLGSVYSLPDLLLTSSMFSAKNVALAKRLNRNTALFMRCAQCSCLSSSQCVCVQRCLLHS